MRGLAGPGSPPVVRSGPVEAVGEPQAASVPSRHVTVFIGADTLPSARMTGPIVSLVAARLRRRGATTVLSIAAIGVAAALVAIVAGIGLIAADATLARALSGAGADRPVVRDLPTSAAPATDYEAIASRADDAVAAHLGGLTEPRRAGRPHPRAARPRAAGVRPRRRRRRAGAPGHPRRGPAAGAVPRWPGLRGDPPLGDAPEFEFDDGAPRARSGADHRRPRPARPGACRSATSTSGARSAEIRSAAGSTRPSRRARPSSSSTASTRSPRARPSSHRSDLRLDGAARRRRHPSVDGRGVPRRRRRAVTRDLTAAGPGYTVTSPRPLIRIELARADAASARLLLIGSLGVAILLAFAVFLALVIRDDVAAEVARLAAVGARRRDRRRVPRPRGRRSRRSSAASSAGSAAGSSSRSWRPGRRRRRGRGHRRHARWRRRRSLAAVIVIVVAIVATVAGHRAGAIVGRRRPDDVAIGADGDHRPGAGSSPPAGRSARPPWRGPLASPIVVLLPPVARVPRRPAASWPCCRRSCGPSPGGRPARRCRVRLSLLSISREPARPAATLTLLAFSLGAIVFATGWSASLRAGIDDAAAYRSGLDLRVTELGTGLSISGSVVPVDRYAALGDDVTAVPVYRDAQHDPARRPGRDRRPRPGGAADPAGLARGLLDDTGRRAGASG